MKRFFIILLIIPVLSCNSGGDNSFRGTTTAQALVPNSVLKQLKEGDFILRQGGGAFSEKIIEFMGEQRHFSHIGLVARVDGKLKIIHSVSEELSGRDGVQTQAINAFVSDVADSNLCIVRPKLSPEQIEAVVNNAKYYLDKGATFDYDYNTDDSTKLYCIELMYYALGPVIGKKNFDIKDCGDGVYIPLFSTFFKPEFFETIFCLKQY